MKTYLFGLIWVVALSPLTVFLLLGSMTDQTNPSLYEVFMVLWGTFMYWKYIWLPVCYYFDKQFLEFCELIGWKV